MCSYVKAHIRTYVHAAASAAIECKRRRRVVQARQCCLPRLLSVVERGESATVPASQSASHISFSQCAPETRHSNKCVCGCVYVFLILTLRSRGIINLTLFRPPGSATASVCFDRPPNFRSPRITSGTRPLFFRLRFSSSFVACFWLLAIQKTKRILPPNADERMITWGLTLFF